MEVVQVNVRVSGVEYQALKEMADRQGVTITGLFRRFVSLYLAVGEPNFAIIPYDVALFLMQVGIQTGLGKATETAEGIARGNGEGLSGLLLEAERINKACKVIRGAMGVASP